MVERNKMTHCPVCNAEMEDLPYEICENCGWERSPWQELDPDQDGSVNVMSLNQARAEWEKGNKVY